MSAGTSPRYVQRMTGIIATALCICGCARQTRIAVSLPIELLEEVDDPAIQVTTASQTTATRSEARTRQLESMLARSLLRTGRYRLLDGAKDSESTKDAPRGPHVEEADLILEVRLDDLHLEKRVHHVHRYYDASASANATVRLAATGERLHVAQKTAYLSTRARYSSPAYVEDLVMTRLAEKLARSLLYEDTVYFVDLANSEKMPVRGGIDRARRGDWHRAIDTWQTGLGGNADGILHFNIGVAHAVLGDREQALAHLKNADGRGLSGRNVARMRHRIETRGVPWEVP